MTHPEAVVIFDDLSFSYRKRERLQNVGFHANKGEW